MEPRQRLGVVDHPVLARLLMFQVLQDQDSLVRISAEEHRHHRRVDPGRELQRGHLTGVPLGGIGRIDELLDHDGCSGQLHAPNP